MTHLLLYMFAFLPGSAVQHQDAVDAMAKQYMERRDLVGLAIGVIWKEQFNFYGYGQADLGGNVPISEKTVFDLGSIKKHVTGAAILQLVKEKKLRLNDPLRKWIPRDDVHPGITLTHMLHQISGLPDTPEEPLTIEWEPGTQWGYRNANFDLLDEVIQKASGETFYAYATRQFFGSTYPSIRKCNGETLKDTKSYAIRENQRAPVETKPCWFVGNARDTTFWFRDLMRGKVLSKDQVRRMIQAAKLENGQQIPYGFGLELSPFAGQQKVWHTGHFSGFTSALSHYPEHDLTVVVMSNADTLFDPESIEMEVARIFLNLPPRKQAEPEKQQDAHLFKGIYDSGPIWFRFRVKENRLYMTMQGPNESWEYVTLEMRQESKDHFVAVEAPDAVSVVFRKSHGSDTYNRSLVRMVGTRWPCQRR